MASLTERINRLLRSRRAAQLAERARRLARDPATRRALTDLRARLTSRR
jgi:hypothetical protein